MRKRFRKLMGMLTSTAMLLGTLMQFPAQQAAIVSAASTDYPAVLMNIAAKDNATVLTENGTSDGSTLSAKALGSTLSCSWRFDRVGSNSVGTFFKLCNAESGRLLTPKSYNVTAGNDVIMYGSESAQSQHWYVVPVSTDHLGNNLYYKIVNYSDSSLALTRGSSGMTLASYSGADSQLWLLNPDGDQGFAGYCSDDQPNVSGSTIKAADIGGLFGEIVEASTFSQLKSYCNSTTPYTIIVTGNISVSSLTKDSSGRYYCPDGRIYVEGNKTIIGSYSNHTLNNVALLTDRNSSTCNNIIIKNFDFQHSVDANGNDNITVYFSGGENLWVDHCTFTGHSDYNKASTGLEDYDKFFACCYNADYCTVSDCSFGLHEYGLILGYPDDTAAIKASYDNFPRMSIISNKFYQTLTRGPGLMRWGYYHSLCNYVDTFSMAYTVHSGCDIYAENCYYANGGNVICDWNSITYAGAYAESGSTFVSCNRTVQGQGTSSNPSYSTASSWRPNTNYSYTTISSANAKTYCSNYSGCQSSRSNYMYLRFAAAGVPSAGYTEAPNGLTAAEFADGSAFMMQNVNSGLYLEVKDGNAANGENIQQWGANGEGEWNVWRLYSAGDGYYYVYSALGDGKTYVLDVAGKKADDGTNIDLYQYNGGDNQKFKFVQNSDGSYKIYTKVSNDASVLDVENGSFDYGANVQEWTMNGFNCQDWNLIAATLPINGVLVQNLAVSDSDHAASWGIAYNAGVGSTVFGDRTFTVVSMPDALTGAEQIITACDSKLVDSDLAVFTAAADITVYVALDSRQTPVPAWLSAYKNTGLTVTMSNDVIFNLYALDVAAGTSVTLGTNGGSTSVVNYAVFVTEQAELIGDIVADGSVNMADLVALQRYLLTMRTFTESEFNTADISGDGKVNAKDFTLLKRILLGL